jgi:hypothetical protein
MKTGVWNGGLGPHGGLACDQIEGVPRTDSAKPYVPHGITYFVAGPSDELPAHVVGAVVRRATAVDVYLTGGKVVRASTFAGPEELGDIRFFATMLPDLPSSPGTPPRSPVRKLVGLDDSGHVVACLLVPLPPGVSRFRPANRREPRDRGGM